MGQRRKPRIKMVVPIRIWGTDSAGKPFNILAYTLNVSSTGARVGGVKAPLGVGDAVTIQYKQQRALFKVVWIGQPGDPTQEQVGVTLLEQDRQIWTEIDETRVFLDDFSGQRSSRPSATPTPPPAEPKDEPTLPVEVAEAAEDAASSAGGGTAPPETVEALPISKPARDPNETVRIGARALMQIEAMVKRTPPSAAALQEFRDAIAKTRQTVWALQQWYEMRSEAKKAFPLLSYLNSERLRFVVQAVQELADDVANKGVELDTALLDDFFRGVSKLRSSTGTHVTKEQEEFSVEVVRPGAEQSSSRRSAEMVQALKDAAAEVRRSGMATSTALQHLARETQRTLDANGVAIACLQDDEMVCAGSSGNAPEAGTSLESEAGLGGEAIEKHQLVYCRDTQADPRVEADLCKAADIGSVLMAPVPCGSGPAVGMVQISASKANAFEPAHLDAARVFADLVGTILKQPGVSASK